MKGTMAWKGMTRGRKHRGKPANHKQHSIGETLLAFSMEYTQSGLNVNIHTLAPPLHKSTNTVNTFTIHTQRDAMCM